MKDLFVDFDNLAGTAYWEFAAGNWNNETYWCKDSIYIHDDILFHSDFFDIVLGIIPNCDPLSKTKVSKEQWEQIFKEAVSGGGPSAEIVQSAESWVTENFQKHNVFYILGV